VISTSRAGLDCRAATRRLRQSRLSASLRFSRYTPASLAQKKKHKPLKFNPQISSFLLENGDDIPAEPVASLLQINHQDTVLFSLESHYCREKVPDFYKDQNPSKPTQLF
jgi:hypothetical protein